MKNFLILGSNSFAGSSLINELLCQKEEVIGISRSKEKENCVLTYSDNPLRKKLFTFFSLDLNNNFDEICGLIKKFKPKFIVDFAAQSMVGESWNWPEHWFKTNMVSKVKLHNFLKNQDFLEKYIRISTPEIYGNTNKIIRENSELDPSTPYAVSQAAIDMSLKTFYNTYQFPVIFTRFANFYGPFQQVYRIIPKTILTTHLKLKLPLHGGGNSKRSFIFHKDVSSGIIQSIKYGKLGNSYHFSTKELISISDLVKKICIKMNVNFDDLIENTSDRIGKDKTYSIDFAKANKEINWKPKFNLDQGIDITIKWVEKNLSQLKKIPLNYIHKK